jgi:hypothetical protein
MNDFLAASITVLIMLWLSVGTVSAWIACYISGEKGRGNTEGFLFGFLLGPFGALIAVLMPAPASPIKPALTGKELVSVSVASFVGLFLLGAFLSYVGQASRSAGKTVNQVPVELPEKVMAPIAIRVDDTIWLVPPNPRDKTLTAWIDGREVKLPGFLKALVLRTNVDDPKLGLTHQVEILDGPYSGKRATVRVSSVRAAE